MNCCRSFKAIANFLGPQGRDRKRAKERIMYRSCATFPDIFFTGFRSFWLVWTTRLWTNLYIWMICTNVDFFKTIYRPGKRVQTSTFPTNLTKILQSIDMITLTNIFITIKKIFYSQIYGLRYISTFIVLYKRIDVTLHCTEMFLTLTGNTLILSAWLEVD